MFARLVPTVAAAALTAVGAGTALAGEYDIDPLEQAAVIAPESAAPWEAWSIGLDVGALWRVTDNTHLDYFVMPAVLNVRTPAHWIWGVGRGKLVTRVNGLADSAIPDSLPTVAAVAARELR